MYAPLAPPKKPSPFKGRSFRISPPARLGYKNGFRGIGNSDKAPRRDLGEKKASRNSTHKAPNKTLNKETTATASLENFDRMSIKAAEKVITSYSTSFSFATHVLEPELRTDIRNLYAMVRTADEIVDGTAHAAGLTSAQTAKLLADYEREVLLAPTQRLHVDPVMHAYAISARRCHFKEEHVRAFSLPCAETSPALHTMPTKTTATTSMAPLRSLALCVYPLSW